MLNKKIKVLGLLVFLTVLSVTWAGAQRGGDTSRTFKVKKGGTLVIEADNVYADIEIRVWNKSEVRVEVEGIPEDDLDDLEMGESGNTITVEYFGGGGGWRRSRQVTFMASVPSEFNLVLLTSGGDIEVDDEIKGSVEARTSGGDIEVDDVEGELLLRTSGGDITARNVVGDAELNTSGGDIEVGDVDGQLDVHTSGGDITVGVVKKDLEAKTAGGDVHVGDVGGYADVSTAGGDIILGNVSGTASLRTAGGDIELRSASGRVTAQTAGGDIELEKISGSCKAETAGGDIIIELTPSGNRGSSFETAGGDIELYIPSNAKTKIEARIRVRSDDHWYNDDHRRTEYQIYSDFKATTKDEDRRGISATFVLNGGGKTITLETANGDIYIKKLKK